MTKPSTEPTTQTAPDTLPPPTGPVDIIWAPVLTGDNPLYRSVVDTLAQRHFPGRCADIESLRVLRDPSGRCVIGAEVGIDEHGDFYLDARGRPTHQPAIAPMLPGTVLP